MADTGSDRDGTLDPDSDGTGLLAGQGRGEQSLVGPGANTAAKASLFAATGEWGFRGRQGSLQGHRTDTGEHQDFSAQWAVPWSDLMMVMFVLFAVLFAMQLTERDINEMFEPEQPPDATLPSQLDWQSSDFQLGGNGGAPMSAEEILRESEKLIAEANLDNTDVVLTDRQAIKVSVRGPMLFDLGKADLRSEVQEFLTELAAIIAKNNYQVQVVGHTDNFPISTPEFPTNWELSSARAARVARYLIREGRLEPGRFTVIGQSLYRPVAPNTSPANKRQNRRVEIIITRNEYQS